MAQVDATRFLELLHRSRLVDESGLEKSLQNAPAATREKADVIAQYLVDEGLLTRWQADNVLISANDIYATINDVNTTNYTLSNTSGVFYYHITIFDKPDPPGGSPFTNESWYSPELVIGFPLYELHVATNGSDPEWEEF